MFRCMGCGKELAWMSDFCLDEIHPEEAINEKGEIIDNGVVGMYSCGSCELDYEITTYENNEKIRVEIYEIEE